MTLVASIIHGWVLTINDGHGAPGCGRDEVRVDLENGSLTQQTLRQILARQLASSLQLLVPIPSINRNLLRLYKINCALHEHYERKVIFKFFPVQCTEPGTSVPRTYVII
jgi:hypothetical protein